MAATGLNASPGPEYTSQVGSLHTVYNHANTVSELYMRRERTSATNSAWFHCFLLACPNGAGPLHPNWLPKNTLPLSLWMGSSWFAAQSMPGNAAWRGAPCLTLFLFIPFARVESAALRLMRDVKMSFLFLTTKTYINTPLLIKAFLLLAILYDISSKETSKFHNIKCVFSV